MSYQDKLKEIFTECVPALDLHEDGCEIHNEDSIDGECTCRMAKLQEQILSLIQEERQGAVAEYDDWITFDKHGYVMWDNTVQVNAYKQFIKSLEDKDSQQLT